MALTEVLLMIIAGSLIVDVVVNAMAVLNMKRFNERDEEIRKYIENSFYKKKILEDKISW